MEVKTYRAKSLQQALQMVRRDLGPDAAVLHTREIGGGLLGLIQGPQIEVMASVDVDVPSRFANAPPAPEPRRKNRVTEFRSPVTPPAHELDYRAKFREDLKDQFDDLQSMVEELCERSEMTPDESEDAGSRLLRDLVDADFSETAAARILDRLWGQLRPEERDSYEVLRTRLRRMLEEGIRCSGPIVVEPGRSRLVALVGPTGVGKTTTIAKLAAQFHLVEKCRVGLITVDTYRIAAVDQLRTYADIIDLPMEVVGSPRELRTALARLADMDLVLIDTAGRSPSDDLKIQELRAVLTEAEADEVHLVLSSVASASSIRTAIEQFRSVGVTSVMLTKLDEATTLGGLWALLQETNLPVSYLTMGQNVPDDIAPAHARLLARRILPQEGGR